MGENSAFYSETVSPDLYDEVTRITTSRYDRFASRAVQMPSDGSESLIWLEAKKDENRQWEIIHYTAVKNGQKEYLLQERVQHSSLCLFDALHVCAMFEGARHLTGRKILSNMALPGANVPTIHYREVARVSGVLLNEQGIPFYPEKEPVPSPAALVDITLVEKFHRAFEAIKTMEELNGDPAEIYRARMKLMEQCARYLIPAARDEQTFQKMLKFISLPENPRAQASLTDNILKGDNFSEDELKIRDFAKTLLRHNPQKYKAFIGEAVTAIENHDFYKGLFFLHVTFSQANYLDVSKEILKVFPFNAPSDIYEFWQKILNGALKLNPDLAWNILETCEASAADKARVLDLLKLALLYDADIARHTIKFLPGKLGNSSEMVQAVKSFCYVVGMYVPSDTLAYVFRGLSGAEGDEIDIWFEIAHKVAKPKTVAPGEVIDFAQKVYASFPWKAEDCLLLINNVLTNPENFSHADAVKLLSLTHDISQRARNSDKKYELINKMTAISVGALARPNETGVALGESRRGFLGWLRGVFGLASSAVMLTPANVRKAQTEEASHMLFNMTRNALFGKFGKADSQTGVQKFGMEMLELTLLTFPKTAPAFFERAKQEIFTGRETLALTVPKTAPAFFEKIEQEASTGRETLALGSAKRLTSAIMVLNYLFKKHLDELPADILLTAGELVKACDQKIAAPHFDDLRSVLEELKDTVRKLCAKNLAQFEDALAIEPARS